GTGAVNIQSSTSTYTGNTVVNAGNLVLTGFGNLANSPNIIVNRGATLSLDNTGLVFTPNLTGGRLGSTNTLTLNGGNFNFISNSFAGSSETIGTIVLAGGLSTVLMTQDPNAAFSDHLT